MSASNHAKATELESSTRVLRLVAPVYPTEAVARRGGGVAVATFSLSMAGSPVEVAFEGTASEFSDALAAVFGKWLYPPPRCTRGQIVPHRVNQRVEFDYADGNAYVVAKGPTISYSPRAELPDAKVSRPLPSPDVEKGAPTRVIFHPTPQFPRAAIRLGIERGKVTAILTISAEGFVRDVAIVDSEPCGLFDKSVRDALLQWTVKPEADGNDYQASVEMNFTIKDVPP